MRAGLNRLWQWTAGGGIVLSLYAGWLTVDDVRDRASSEREISAACDRLVSPAEVMDLRGGMVRAMTSDDDRIDAGASSSSCTVYKVPDPGKSEYLFTLSVRGSGTSEPLNWVGDDSALEPFDDLGKDGDGRPSDVTAVADRRPEPQPLGDGTLGWYGNWFTTVRVECAAGSSATAPELLHVTARADYDDVSSADRQRLARLARSAAERLTDRVGCRTRLPELPDQQLGTVPSVLRPAKTAGGTCRWFARHLGQEGQGQLPDRVLAAPARDRNPVESCLLAVSPRQVRHIAEGVPDDDREYADSALTHSPWWLRTVSYVGTEARAVGYDDLRDDKVIKTGTAGHGRGVWWASSVCDGKPALHTLSSSYLYDNVLDSRSLASLFRAYVDDIAQRRGCTHVTYPDAKDFRTS